uniref:Translation initiation factor eIF2B subunit delta n=1 Tax=Globisporangium ultimum (strain ATCC 200006 / CBS 805.95 / DAOM BR144) TaxID=431595 RepID=K3WT83_GLOUD
MADTKTSPVLAPGAELKHLEDILDAQKTKKGMTKEQYESQLEGWSPSPGQPSDNDTVGGMENLSLGPSASAANEEGKPKSAEEAKQLSKAERKKLAAEAFAAKNGAAVSKREKMSKQERRAMQEAQRASKDAPAAKVVKKAEIVAPSGVRMQYDDAKKVARRSKASVVVRTQAQKQVPLFSHLPQYERESSLSLNVGFSNKEIHPSVLSLGLKYAEGKILGGNARCIAMLNAFKEVIADYVTPVNKVLSRDLDKSLRPLIQYLIDCRPHCISMGNAIRSLRSIISTTSPELSDDEAKKHIIGEIDEYIQSRIILAMRAVSKHAQSKISEGDVILTYARSNVVEMILKEAHELRKINFRVIVVDSRPHYEGKKLVKSLADTGLPCTYIHINALSYIMRDVTKVLLGASAFMSNGVAVGRVGTAMVAITARDANIPVLFCCETYKFSDRVQLDSITHNELRDPDELISSCSTEKSRQRSGGSSHVLSDWRDIPNLKLLNLVYDVTPIEYVSMVVTELGMIPPTSIPAILREYSKEGLVDPLN